MEFSKKQISVAFVLICLAFFWTYVKLQKLETENKQMKSQTSKLIKQVDSLENEIFVLELKLFRHERAYEIFEEKNPQASSQLGDIISDETE